MFLKIFVICLIFFVYSNRAGYVLQDNFHGSTFFNDWYFFTANDPTDGYVNYVSKEQAQQLGLIGTQSNGNVYMGADHTNKATGRGRNSVRINTFKAYNRGLFVIDLDHMPWGCGTWPAFWLVGPNWPNGGELDIIEGVNINEVVQTSAHTSNNCIQSKSTSKFNGYWANKETNSSNPATNCYVYASDEYFDTGCAIFSKQNNTYGKDFNRNGGGVYVLEWTNDFIRSFFFTHSNIPNDLTINNPNPSTWGMPYAYFELGTYCPSSHFSNMNIVFDLTFCGSWAGSVFASDCKKNVTCNSYVQNEPSEFQDAFWSIKYVKVFTQ